MISFSGRLLERPWMTGLGLQPFVIYSYMHKKISFRLVAKLSSWAQKNIIFQKSSYKQINSQQKPSLLGFIIIIISFQIQNYRYIYTYF
jgi:hypothetical protein